MALKEALEAQAAKELGKIYRNRSAPYGTMTDRVLPVGSELVIPAGKNFHMVGPVDIQGRMEFAPGSKVVID